MAGPIVFISHQRVKPERFDEFAAFFAEGSKAIEADKPGTVVFLAFTDLERGETLDRPCVPRRGGDGSPYAGRGRAIGAGV